MLPNLEHDLSLSDDWLGYISLNFSTLENLISPYTLHAYLIEPKSPFSDCRSATPQDCLMFTVHEVKARVSSASTELQCHHQHHHNHNHQLTPISPERYWPPYFGHIIKDVSLRLRQRCDFKPDRLQVHVVCLSNLTDADIDRVDD